MQTFCVNVSTSVETVANSDRYLERFVEKETLLESGKRLSHRDPFHEPRKVGSVDRGNQTGHAAKKIFCLK